MARTPKNERYFELFEELAALAHEGARVFVSEGTTQEKFNLLTDLETRGDDIVAETRDMLDHHQDPPLEDREAVYRLVNNIDNILDGLKKASGRIVIADLGHMQEFAQMGEVVEKAALVVKQNAYFLRELKPKLRMNKKAISALRKACLNINALEKEGDAREFECHQSLKKHHHFGWHTLYAKDVIELLEHILNQCEDVADTVDTLMKLNA